MPMPPKLNGEPAGPTHSSSGALKTSGVTTGKSGDSAKPPAAGSPVKFETKNALVPSATNVSKTSMPTGIDVALATPGMPRVRANNSAVDVFHARMTTTPLRETSG